MRGGHSLGSAVLAALVWLVVYGWSAAPIPFYDKGEPREALVVRAVREGHGFVLPRPDGIDLPAKPPLFHWLAALALAAGVQPEELAIRAPSIVFGSLGVGVTTGLAVATLGVRVGLFTALVLGSSFEWMRAATQARVDMTITVLLTGAILAWLLATREHRSGLARLGWMLAAGAVLTKGPVGIVLPCLVVGADAMTRREIRSLAVLIDPLGILAFGALWIGWFVLAWSTGGQEFVGRQIVAENLNRFTGEGKVPHRHGTLYYLPALAGSFGPWTLALPAVVHRLRREITPTDRVLLVWSLTVLIFYSLAAGKRSVYLLPLFPPLAMLTAASLVDALTWTPGQTTRIILVEFAALLVGAAVMLHWNGLPATLGAIGPFLPGSDGQRMPAVATLVRNEVPILTGLLLAAAGCLTAMSSSVERVRFAACAGLALLWTVGLPVLGTWPLARAISSREGAAAVRAQLTPDDEPCAATFVDNGFRYYLGRSLRSCDELRARGAVPTIEVHRVVGPTDGRRHYETRRPEPAHTS